MKMVPVLSPELHLPSCRFALRWLSICNMWEWRNMRGWYKYCDMQVSPRIHWIQMWNKYWYVHLSLKLNNINYALCCWITKLVEYNLYRWQRAQKKKINLKCGRYANDLSLLWRGQNFRSKPICFMELYFSEWFNIWKTFISNIIRLRLVCMP